MNADENRLEISFIRFYLRLSVVNLLSVFCGALRWLIFPIRFSVLLFFDRSLAHHVETRFFIFLDVRVFGRNSYAGGELARFDLDQRGLDPSAFGDGKRAARVKITTLWRIYGRRHVAL
jgi:hypothetical protein